MSKSEEKRQRLKGKLEELHNIVGSDGVPPDVGLSWNDMARVEGKIEGLREAIKLVWEIDAATPIFREGDE